jgi:hypothetical protein
LSDIWQLCDQFWLALRLIKHSGYGEKRRPQLTATTATTAEEEAEEEEEKDAESSAQQTDRHAQLYIVPELKVPFPNLSVSVAVPLSGKLLSCLVLFWEAQIS